MLLLTALLFATAQPPADSVAIVRGRVTDAATAQPIAEAAVTVAGTRLGALTDASGRYEIRRVPSGAVTIVAGRIGYTTTRTSLTLAGGETRTLDLTLAAAGATLSAVKVEARTTEREQFTLSADPGLFAVRGETLKRVPVIGEPDVLRVVQLMPGVVATNDFNAGYNVRGGESDQNLVLLDGYPIYNPFHLAGLFGTFIDETVGEFELIPGGMPARYGTRLSSVLTITPKAEQRSGVHGTLSASVLATSLALGGRVGDRTSWNVAGRRTYADRFVALLSSSSLPYWFTDAQAHVRHELRNGGRLSLTAYTGEDVLAGFFSGLGDSTSAGQGGLRFDWGNSLIGAAWEQPLARLAGGDSARLMQRVSRTGFGTTLDLGNGSLTLDNRVAEWRAWGEATRWRGRHETLLGYEWSAYRVSYDVDAPAAGGAPLLTQRQRPSAGALYVDQTVRGERITARAGLRAETVTGTGWAALSPRASMKWFANSDLAFTLSAGRPTQWTPAPRNQQAPGRPVDFWPP
ncbi:MAG TPA: TonB-dependent receptor, partial [Gemmatimonadaceae bacterium]|nr:TonB-dependent receptor [Gemmatimonadaceae bacterium]